MKKIILALVTIICYTCIISTCYASTPKFKHTIKENKCLLGKSFGYLH